MYYYEYMSKIKKNDNDCDIYELLNQAANDKDVTYEEWEEIRELFYSLDNMTD